MPNNLPYRLYWKVFHVLLNCISYTKSRKVTVLVVTTLPCFLTLLRIQKTSKYNNLKALNTHSFNFSVAHSVVQNEQKTVYVRSLVID